MSFACNVGLGGEGKVSRGEEVLKNSEISYVSKLAIAHNDTPNSRS